MSLMRGFFTLIADTATHLIAALVYWSTGFRRASGAPANSETRKTIALGF
jgi:hypothetical protein